MTERIAPVVADTHAFIWYVHADSRLTQAARTAMHAAAAGGSPVFVSAATAVELRYLVEKGRITENDFRLYSVILYSESTEVVVSPVDLDVAHAVDRVPRSSVSDPFDRMIAATAVTLGLPLVTADKKLRDLPVLETIW